MRGSTGDRFWQREPIAPTLVPSRGEEIPETHATLRQLCPRLHTGGLCAVPLAIRSDQQARALPQPKGGTRGGLGHGEWLGKVASGEWPVARKE